MITSFCGASLTCSATTPSTPTSSPTPRSSRTTDHRCRPSMTGMTGRDPRDESLDVDPGLKMQSNAYPSKPEHAEGWCCCMVQHTPTKSGPASDAKESSPEPSVPPFRAACAVHEGCRVEDDGFSSKVCTISFNGVGLSNIRPSVLPDRSNFFCSSPRTTASSASWAIVASSAYPFCKGRMRSRRRQARLRRGPAISPTLHIRTTLYLTCSLFKLPCTDMTNECWYPVHA